MTSASSENPLVAYLTQNFAVTRNIDGFVISAHKDTPTNNAILDVAVDRFHKLFFTSLEHDVDCTSSTTDNSRTSTRLHKLRSTVLFEQVRSSFCFLIGKGSELGKHEDEIERRFDIYPISMKTPDWPFNPEWQGLFGVDEITGFTSSMWRPESLCPVWEETFHVITEACNRLSCSGEIGYENWGFEKGDVLGRFMRADIACGEYDTKAQNREENGEYDFETAVNEYVHQVWVW